MTAATAAAQSVRSRARRALGAAVLLAGLAACTTVLVRAPVPEDRLHDARPYGIEGAFLRLWGDGVAPEDVQRLVELRTQILREHYAREIAAGATVTRTSLALSGGGPDGAFGAGLLAGWTERGDRPVFETVSGVSTGAIIAIFAFLGPDYDATLREIYTTYESKDLVIRTIFAGLTGGTALLDTSGYRRLIERYLTDAVVEKIAQGYRDGRILLIGTTNIDASRPVIWNIGGIAASGHPSAKRLIHDVIQASSAIPAAFPPVLIPVEAGGRRYDEMHVDGGATQQVMLYSPGLRSADLDAGLGDLSVNRAAYVIMNNKISKAYDPVRPRIFSIAGKAASSLIGGSGTGDIYRILAVAQRDDIDLNIISIPRDFAGEATELFDPVYMRGLYELGYELGLSGNAWAPFPPDFAPPEDPPVELLEDDS